MRLRRFTYNQFGYSKVCIGSEFRPKVIAARLITMIFAIISNVNLGSLGDANLDARPNASNVATRAAISLATPATGLVAWIQASTHQRAQNRASSVRCLGQLKHRVGLLLKPVSKPSKPLDASTWGYIAHNSTKPKPKPKPDQLTGSFIFARFSCLSKRPKQAAKTRAQRE